MRDHDHDHDHETRAGAEKPDTRWPEVATSPSWDSPIASWSWSCSHGNAWRKSRCVRWRPHRAGPPIYRRPQDFTIPADRITAPQIDLSKLATLAGLKDDRSAHDSLRGVNRKIKGMRGSPAKNTTSAPAKPRAGTKGKARSRKKKDAAEAPVELDDGWEDAQEDIKPAPIPGLGGAKRKATAAGQGGDGDDPVVLGDGPVKRVKAEDPEDSKIMAE